MGVTEHPTKIFADQVTAKVISSIFCWVSTRCARLKYMKWHSPRHVQRAHKRCAVAMGANVLKVAEHSFSARFCWCKLARAQGFQKTNMLSTERSFYLLNTCTICVIFLYNCMQCIDGFSILLQRYVTKGNDTKYPAFLAFICYRKNTVKCNACAVARKVETDYFSRNAPFSSDPVVRISRNLAKN